MRDNKKDLNYFQSYIKNSGLAIVEDFGWLRDGKVKPDREATFKRSIADAYVGLIISKYSPNYTLHELKLEYATPVRLINESWDGFWKLKNKEGKEYDQYILSAYDEMLGCFL